MTEQVACPACGKTYQVDAALLGRKIRCRACDTQWVPASVVDVPPAGPARTRHTAPEGPLLPPMVPAKHAEDLIDMTAMVDIVFFLLIFFLVTSLQPLESVMDMPTPESASGSIAPKSMSDYENDPDCVMVRIDDDDSIWVDDEQIFGDDEMRRKLRDIRRENAKIISAMIVGSADGSHGAAVRVFDACAAAGLNKLNFTVEEPTE